MISIREKVLKLEKLLKSKDLTNFEELFTKSILNKTGEKVNTTILSERQIDIIDNIYNKHF